MIIVLAVWYACILIWIHLICIFLKWHFIYVPYSYEQSFMQKGWLVQEQEGFIDFLFSLFHLWVLENVNNTSYSNHQFLSTVKVVKILLKQYSLHFLHCFLEKNLSALYKIRHNLSYLVLILCADRLFGYLVKYLHLYLNLSFKEIVYDIVHMLCSLAL